MIVVDTNILCYLFLSGDFSAEAEKAYLKDSDWAAPLIWRSEFRNVLAQYIRKEILSLKDAAEIMEYASGLMENNEYDVASDRVLDLIDSSSLTAYDCEFVALANDLGVKLVTADKRIAEQFPADTILLINFVI